MINLDEECLYPLRFNHAETVPSLVHSLPCSVLHPKACFFLRFSLCELVHQFFPRSFACIAPVIYAFWTWRALFLHWSNDVAHWTLPKLCFAAFKLVEDHHSDNIGRYHAIARVVTPSNVDFSAFSLFACLICNRVINILIDLSLLNHIRDLRVQERPQQPLHGVDVLHWFFGLSCFFLVFFDLICLSIHLVHKVLVVLLYFLTNALVHLWIDILHFRGYLLVDWFLFANSLISLVKFLDNLLLFSFSWCSFFICFHDKASNYLTQICLICWLRRWRRWGDDRFCLLKMSVGRFHVMLWRICLANSHVRLNRKWC